MKALQKNDDVIVYIQSLLNEGFSLPYYNISHLLHTYNYSIADIHFIKPNKKQPRLTIHSIKETKKGVNLLVYEESWSNYLPLVLKNETLEEFLYGFQLSMFKQIEVIDNIETLFTPEKTPEAFVEWIASWFNIAFSDKIKLKNRRKIIYKLTELYNAKGTKFYLKEMVLLLTDITIEIKERAVLDNFSTSNKNLSFIVTIIKEPPYVDHLEKNLMHQIVKSIIENEKPIFTNALFDDSFELNQASKKSNKTPFSKETITLKEPVIKEKEVIYKEKNQEEQEEEPKEDKKSGYDDFF
jgi:phage tail-like protein